MSSLTACITPWYRRTADRSESRSEQSGSIAPTRILDYQSAPVSHLVDSAGRLADSLDQDAVLKAAHALIRDEVRAVYALEEKTPSSRVLTRGFGSCSQRLAVLESVARSIGIATRVRALLIDRAFWYPRFPSVRLLLPDVVLLAWPEFKVQGWKPASELFGPVGCHGGVAFSNRGSETLFEAVGRCAVDWDGKSNDAAYDLSHFVRNDYGHFANRDDAFRELGQTLCAPSRFLADPLLRHIAA